MREKIEGEKIILRKYETDFAPLLFEAAIESQGGEFTRWMPWCHENYSIAESESFVKKCVEDWETETEYNFGIFDAESGEFVGGIGLNLFNEVRRLMNLGYWVRTGFQGRGIAHSATKLLARAAFEDLKLNRIEIAAAS